MSWKSDYLYREFKLAVMLGDRDRAEYWLSLMRGLAYDLRARLTELEVSAVEVPDDVSGAE